MKKLILAFVAMITMTSVQAQDDNSSRGERRRFDRTEMLKRRTDETAKKYGLNEEQAAKLLELNTKYADKIGANMGAPRDGRRGNARPGFDANRDRNRQQGQRPQMTEEQRQQMEKQRAERLAAMEQYAAELQTIMTPDQFKAYQADMEKNMRQGGARRGGPRGEQQEQPKQE